MVHAHRTASLKERLEVSLSKGASSLMIPSLFFVAPAFLIFAIIGAFFSLGVGQILVALGYLFTIAFWFIGEVDERPFPMAILSGIFFATVIYLEAALFSPLIACVLAVFPICLMLITVVPFLKRENEVGTYRKIMNQLDRELMGSTGFRDVYLDINAHGAYQIYVRAERGTPRSIIPAKNEYRFVEFVEV